MIDSLRWLLAGATCGLACAGPATGEEPDQRGSGTEPDVTTTFEPVVDPAAVTGSVYLVMDGVELTMDVRTPPGDVAAAPGRPVVVLFHGLWSATNDAEDVTGVADAAAEAGMVVFAPEWIAGDPFPLTFDDISMLRRAAECAVAFAQQEASAVGGDPTRVVTSGFSAGTGPALAAAVAPRNGDELPGCRAAPRRADVVGTVLGDGEYFWHSAAFDGPFAENAAGMRDATDLFVDPSNWRAGPAPRIRLWAAADGTAPRAIAEPGAEGWLDVRDTDGAIRSDLDAIGASDDGFIDYLESAMLFERRVAASGADVDLTIYPGGHTTNDKVAAIVEHLSAVAAES